MEEEFQKMEEREVRSSTSPKPEEALRKVVEGQVETFWKVVLSAGKEVSMMESVKKFEYKKYSSVGLSTLETLIVSLVIGKLVTVVDTAVTTLEMFGNAVVYPGIVRSSVPFSVGRKRRLELVALASSSTAVVTCAKN